MSQRVEMQAVIDDLRARIAKALAVPHGPFGPWDDDLCEYEQVREALIGTSSSLLPDPE